MTAATIKGLKSFCRRTGWPIEELLNADIWDVMFVLGIHGYTTVVHFPGGESFDLAAVYPPEGL